MYFGSFTAGGVVGDIRQQIFPSDITLRVSTLSCSVETPTLIDFGEVSGRQTAGAEIAKKRTRLHVNCTQDSDRIGANINVQIRALSGLYAGNKSRLALQEGGGYITGEISDGITGSGQCKADSGVAFDSRSVKIGTMTATDTTKAFGNDITWRLCSGGASLPYGDVHASAELLVTFN